MEDRKNCGEQGMDTSACEAVDSSTCQTKQENAKRNTLALVSLVVGLIAMVFNLFGLIGAAAIVIGVQAKKQIKNSGESGKGMAAAGIALGAVDLGITVISLLVLIIR